MLQNFIFFYLIYHSVHTIFMEFWVLITNLTLFLLWHHLYATTHTFLNF